MSQAGGLAGREGGMTSLLPDSETEPAAGAGDGDARRALPLAGIRVVDLTRLLAGPYAAMLLADLGAEVIKVEEPPCGDLVRHTVEPRVPGGEDAAYFASINRGKKSIVVDLKEPDGLAVVKRLAAVSDVLLDNFRPGVLERLGLDAATLAELNPRLVVCSISAFGQTGPYRDRTAVDLNIQALSGAMSLTGEGGDRPPLRLGLPMADLAGGLFAVIGILAALERRRRSGGGSRVDVGLLDSLVSFLTYMAANYAVTGEEPPPVGSAHHSVVPYQAFRTQDGWLVLTSFSERLWPRICRALGREDLAGDERFATNAARVGNRETLIPILEGELARRGTGEWLALFGENDVPASPINRVSAALEDPQVRHRRMVRTLPLPEGGDLEVVGNPVKFSDLGEPANCEPYPLLGEDTAAVLAGLLGYDDAAIGDLHERGVVTCRKLSATKGGVDHARPRR